MPPKIFITHSWKDIDFARRLHADLKEQGFEVWFDDATLKAGHRMAEEINRGLAWCDYYLPILSRAALASNWCAEEVNAALSLSVESRNVKPRIISVLIENCRDEINARFPSLVARLYMDFTTNYDDALRDLLTKGFGVTPKPRPTTPPEMVAPVDPPADPPAVVPPPVDPPKPMLISTLAPDDIDRIYWDAIAECHLGHWQIAADNLRQVVAVKPDYEDAQARLAEAEQYLELAKMYHDGFYAMEAQRWAEAVQKLQTLLKLSPNYGDAQTLFANAKRFAELPELYRRALKAIDAKQWGDAKSLLEQIQKTDPNFQKSKQLLAHVLTEISRPKIGKDGKEMILIPTGEFVMGEGNEARKISLDAFYISRYPVTNAEYKKFVDATNYAVPFVNKDWAKPYNWDQNTRTFPAGCENHPVVLVSWDDAVAYCQWAGVRLPSEQEWEKAARGTDGRMYPWGNEWDRTKCNTASWWVGEDVKDNDDRSKKFEPRYEKEWKGKKILTTPVNQFANGISSYGCFDMVGNVWEWCADWYDNEKKYRVLRGGSLSSSSVYARCAYRYNYDDPDSRFFNIGFRVAEFFPT